MGKFRAIKILSFFLITAFSPIVLYAQDFAAIESRMNDVLEKALGYDNIEKYLLLISWESDIIHNIPCISPVQPPDYRHINISSGYGNRYHPITGEYKHHSGIDLPASRGDSIYAPANGIVLKVGYNTLLGNYIKISHSYNFESIYGHLDSVLIEEQQYVKIGDVIGLAGSTGRSTGPHLHYGIKKNGREEDAFPYCYLLMKYLLERKGRE